MILFGQEHRAIVEQVCLRIVSVDQENFGNVPASRPALDMDDDVERISDVGLDGAIGEVHAALQNTTCEPCEALLRGVRMDGGQCAGVTGVQELQEIEGFATTNLPENDTVRDKVSQLLSDAGVRGVEVVSSRFPFFMALF